MAVNEIDKAVQKLITMTEKKVEIKKVWTNASPTSVFAAQTIKVDCAKAELIIVEFNTPLFIVTKNREVDCWRITSASLRYRSVTVKNTGVSFGAGGYITSLGGTTKTDNSAQIPFGIYTVKGVI